MEKKRQWAGLHCRLAGKSRLWSTRETRTRPPAGFSFLDEMQDGDFRLLPPDLQSLVVEAARGLPDALQAMASLCETDRRFASVCRTALVHRARVDPSLLAFMDPVGAGDRGRLVSPLDIVRAQQRRDAMRACVRYAIYSGVVTKSARVSQSDNNIRLLAFGEFTERDRSRHFMPQVLAQTDNPPDHLVINIDNYNGTQVQFREAMPSDDVAAPYDAAAGALVNQALTGIIAAALGDTDSASDVPMLWVPMDLFGAYPEAVNALEVTLVPGMQEVSLDLAPIVYPDGRAAFIRNYLDPMAQKRARARAPLTWQKC
ncbi:MoaE incomplete domain containing protein [Pandoravirus quercus]|uniref:MoaE incomplete domain containing protein n=2 Tax=Pandoravirus TaxID=2060084 RepID=A0A2U7UAT1_9VIRU|nr:MoaE incomplete domain containing protein [Pandoravirus quercus]AVK75561.1 MoaE incomplete domain containing protein [Pandoravirus quercus]QBZ81736.1 MoaE superfamily incomplete domain containing protein [Pandoravirus celtis]